MNIKKIVIPVVGVSALLTSILLKKKLGSDATNVVSEALTEPEEVFGGIPLSKLNELAKEVYHGLSCTIDQYGYLIFHSKSNRGHQTFHTQMTLDKAGKLINLGGHYPGQWWSTADKFAKKANELFTFK
ncbi:hypothetical protein [Clostridium sp. YIM B02555]|uniref:hypothetical protein n=1 Tax=Clostridium sp. YIM B02555 TaxID=2911968 RepID=UPI001EEF28B4|nr:hypothetical protein [Clostridium sp. YIM B02555]